jgi:hypothetical protein
MRGYWLGWRKGKSAFTADALAGTRERAREGQERETERRGCLFHRAFTLHLSGMSRDRQGELVSYKILFCMKNERLV